MTWYWSTTDFFLPEVVAGVVAVAIDWARVKINLARKNHLLLRKIRKSTNIHTRPPETNRDQGYNLPPLYGTILHPRQNEAARLTANVITEKGIRMDSESFAKLSTNYW